MLTYKKEIWTVEFHVIDENDQMHLVSLDFITEDLPQFSDFIESYNVEKMPEELEKEGITKENFVKYVEEHLVEKNGVLLNDLDELTLTSTEIKDALETLQLEDDVLEDICS